MSEQNAVRNELSLAQENAALRSRVAVLEEELALIQEQFAWLKKQVFGRKTEQSSVITQNRTELCHHGQRSAAYAVSGRTGTVCKNRRRNRNCSGA